jgi:hypothetical protein
MSRDIPTLRGPYLPYAKHHYDWSAVFDELSRESPSRTVKDVAKERGLPYETVRRRWTNYQRVVEQKDEEAIAIACGDVDGRRDNHRVFSREEEGLLRKAIDENKVPLNDEGISRLSLDIHSTHDSTHHPANNTRSHPDADLTFRASSRFVDRIKKEFNLSPQKTNIQRRYVRKKGADWEEERQDKAITFEDDVHQSVLHNGADFVINSDEISCKVISPPLTLLAETNKAISTC